MPDVPPGVDAATILAHLIAEHDGHRDKQVAAARRRIVDMESRLAVAERDAERLRHEVASAVSALGDGRLSATQAVEWITAALEPPPPPSPPPAKRQYGRSPPFGDDDLRAAHAEGGTVADIALRLGASMSTTRAHMHRLGLQANGRPSGISRHALVAAFAEGRSVDEVAGLFGATPGGIRQRMTALGVRLRDIPATSSEGFGSVGLAVRNAN